MSKEMQHISKLKSKRLERKLTQNELATRFNNYIDKNHLTVKHTSYTTISRWESGIVEPKEKALDILASVLNTSPHEIRGYKLTTKEKQDELATLLGRLYDPYRSRFDDTEIREFYDEFFYDDFENLLEFNENFHESTAKGSYVISTNFDGDWDKFDVTSSLDDYLKVFYPNEGKALYTKIFDLIEKIEDQDQLQKSVIEVLPRYTKPFISKLTQDVEKKFTIEHGHWYGPDTILFLKQWFDEQTKIEGEKRHPERKKIRNFYSQKIASPLMNLQMKFDPKYYDPSKRELTSADLHKQIDSIKSSLDKYASMIDKLFFK